MGGGAAAAARGYYAPPPPHHHHPGMMMNFGIPPPSSSSMSHHHPQSLAKNQQVMNNTTTAASGTTIPVSQAMGKVRPPYIKKSSGIKWTKEEVSVMSRTTTFIFVYNTFIPISSSQDDALRAAVEENGAKNWKSISKRLPDRTEVQCLH
jgi:hypothetical protein